MHRLFSAQTVIKRVRIFAKFRVERIERNITHGQTLVSRETQASIGKYANQALVTQGIL